LTSWCFVTAKEAHDARAEVIRQDKAGMVSLDPKMTVESWLRPWLAARRARLTQPAYCRADGLATDKTGQSPVIAMRQK
jgi:hypothetical protein